MNGETYEDDKPAFVPNKASTPTPKASAPAANNTPVVLEEAANSEEGSSDVEAMLAQIRNRRAAKNS
jgi:hypothetical protein